MSDGLDDTWPDLEAPGGNHRHAVDVRTAGLEFQLDAFLLVEPHCLGADLADLVSREQPAELQIDDGPALRAGLDRDERAGPRGRGHRLEDLTPTDLGHDNLPRATGRPRTKAVCSSRE
jgi:hypothetical protein